MTYSPEIASKTILSVTLFIPFSRESELKILSGAPEETFEMRAPGRLSGRTLRPGSLHI